MRMTPLLLAGALVLAAANALAQPVKIGFVNPFRIERESAQGKLAIEELKREFAPREKQLDDMDRQLRELRAQIDKEGATMRDSDRQAREKEFTSRAQRFEQVRVAFAEDFENRRREALSKVVAEANTVIRGIAEAQKFDLILQEAVFIGVQVDITEQVLKVMEKQAAARK